MLIPLSAADDTTSGTYMLEVGRSHVVGRSSDADYKILDPHISRRHARVAVIDGAWMLTDLSSRHGTSVNGRRLNSGETIALRRDDILSFGEWKCAFRYEQQSTVMQTVMDAPLSRIEAVDASRQSGIAQDRLQALIGATRAFASAADSGRVVEVLHRTVCSGTGSGRVFVVRGAGMDGYEILAPDDPGDVVLSRGVLRGAANGQAVELLGEGSAPEGQSIMELGIRSAFCAPINVNGVPDLFLYMDTRGGERTLRGDAVAFCTSLADIAGLALERLIAADMEQRRAEMEQEVRAARDAQELLMPRTSGELASARYAYHSSPGRYVAGDFFDIMDLSGTRTAFFLGDVSGKGAAAGVIMAATQGHLRAMLQQGMALADAMNEVNVQLCERTKDNVFVTLIGAVWDSGTGVLDIVDAGHGYVCVHHAGRSPELVRSEGGMPLGVMSDTPYTCRSMEMGAGVRIVLWSDGAVEQCNPDGTQFGVDAVLAKLGEGDSPESEVALLADAISAYAAGPLADDLTIASIELM